MKTDFIYEFIVLAHYLNFTTAAANLHTSQPNLSKHISEIEQELEVKLFKRDKRLSLTAAGAAFLEDAIQIHHLYKDAKKRAQMINAQNIEEIVIQEPYVIDKAGEILLKSVMKLKTANPQVSVKYYAEKGKKSIELLEEGKIDIALTIDCDNAAWIEKASRQKGLIFVPITQEPLSVWTWEGHPLVEQVSITLEDLVRVPINMTSTRNFDPMRYAILDLFRDALGLRPNLQTHSSETLNEFFMNTHDRKAVFLTTPSVAASPLLAMQSDMTARPIDDERARLTSYLVLREDYEKGAIDQLLEIMEETTSGLLANSHPQ